MGLFKNKDQGEEATVFPKDPKTYMLADSLLGCEVRDTITGFEGTVTCRLEFLYGCVRYNVEGKDVGEEHMNIRIFDEQRLVVLPEEKPVPPTAKTGGDPTVRASRPNPSRR